MRICIEPVTINGPLIDHSLQKRFRIRSSQSGFTWVQSQGCTATGNGTQMPEHPTPSPIVGVEKCLYSLIQIFSPSFCSQSERGHGRNEKYYQEEQSQKSLFCILQSLLLRKYSNMKSPPIIFIIPLLEFSQKNIFNISPGIENSPHIYFELLSSVY